MLLFVCQILRKKVLLFDLNFVKKLNKFKLLQILQQLKVKESPIKSGIKAPI